MIIIVLCIVYWVFPLAYGKEPTLLMSRQLLNTKKDIHAHAACERLFGRTGVNIFTQLKSISWPSK